MSFSIAVFALAWVPCVAFRLRLHVPPGEPVGELGVRRAGLVAMVRPGVRNQSVVVVVPSLPQRVQAPAAAAQAARPRWLLAYRCACFAIALPHDRCWLAWRELTLVTPPKKRVVARRGGRCPAEVLAPAAKLLSWPE
jgi:hypothetical protein